MFENKHELRNVVNNKHDMKPQVVTSAWPVSQVKQAGLVCMYISPHGRLIFYSNCIGKRSIHGSICVCIEYSFETTKKR